MKMKSELLWAMAFAGLLAGCASHHERRQAKHDNPYDAPLVSPGAKFGALPPTVQNTVRAETGSAEIEDIVKETNSSRVVYKVYFRDPRRFPPLYVAADGSVLEPDMTVAVGAAQDTTGVLTGAAVAGVKLTDLPAPVIKVLQTRAPNAEIGSIDKETWGDRVGYIISFKDPAHWPKLYVTSDGTVLVDSPK